MVSKPCWIRIVFLTASLSFLGDITQAQDALKVVDEGQVHLELKASNKPGVFRTGPNFLYVVMPVNLQ